MADAAFVPTVRKADLPGVKTLVCTEGRARRPAFVRSVVRAATPTAFDGAVQADTHDAALQLYSSGTTGLPKGVVLTHAGLISTSRTVAADWQFDHRHVLGNPAARVSMWRA